MGEDVALVVHTSGTTGRPKPVELTYGNVLAQAQGTAAALGLTDDERWLCPLPLSHVGGLMVLLRSVIYATTAVIGPPDRDDVTLASMVPTQLARVLDAGRRRCGPCCSAARPRTARLLERAQGGGLAGGAARYGLTQACSSVTIGEIGDVETSGRPIPGVSVSIAADGEIVVDGPTVDGTLHTGDLGRLDDRGRLVVIGRKADTIVSGGENVAPAEVEAVLLEHPAVAEAGVFARPHPEWGEAVTARVVLRSEATERELRDWVRGAARALQGPEGDRGGRHASAHGIRQAAAERADMSYREENRRRWQTVAAGWEKHADEIRRDTMPVTSWMLDAIEPQPGHQLLEIAAGIGDTGFLAAELIEPGGTLITSDLVPEMLTAAQRRAERARAEQRALPPDRRRGDRPAGREPRRRPLPLRLHADDRRRGRAQGHPARAQARRAARARRLGRPRRQPVDRPARPGAAGARPRRAGAARAPASSPGRRRARSRRTSTRRGSSSTRSSRCRSPCATRRSRDWWDTANDISLRVRERASRDQDDEIVQALAERARPWTAEDGSLQLPARTWVAAATA